MAAPTISRTAHAALVDDTGSNLDGSAWNKAAIASVLLDPIDEVLSNLQTVSPSLTQLRLSLTSGTPIATADASNNSLFITPYGGNKVSIYNGTEWREYSLTEINHSLAATAANTNYDVFLYDNAGTIAVDLTAWSSSTVRATDLATVDGTYVKNGATTRKYVGTIRTTTAGNCTDSVTKRFVWNYYNREARRLKKFDTTSSWTYTSAVWRQARADVTNQVEVVIGVAEVLTEITLATTTRNTNGDVGRSGGIGIDNTTTPSLERLSQLAGPISANDIEAAAVIFSHYPTIGYHYYAWLEYSTAIGTCTWFGGGSAPDFQSGLLGTIEG